MSSSESRGYQNGQEESDWFWQLFPPEYQDDIAFIDLTAQDPDNMLQLGDTDEHEVLSRHNW